MLIVEADLQCPLDDVEGFAGAAMHVRCRRLIFRRHDEVQNGYAPPVSSPAALIGPLVKWSSPPSCGTAGVPHDVGRWLRRPDPHMDARLAISLSITSVAATWRSRHRA